MKSLVRLAHVILLDAGMMCGTDTQRDYETIVSRVKSEGSSFLTITLPDFCKAFERALEEKSIDNVSFPGFSRPRSGLKKSGKAGIPSFLQGILCQIFDKESGLLLGEPNVNAIFAVRQICLLFKKIELTCSRRRVRAAFVRYAEIEAQMIQAAEADPIKHSLLKGCFYFLYAKVMSKLSAKLLNYDLVPKHGPGATAERISGNQKYELLSWPERLQGMFPIDQFGVANPYWLMDPWYVNRIKWLAPEHEPPVRVITVPKTMKSPRIIAIEPVSMQYSQQAIAMALTGDIESDRLLSGQINFSDQMVNRRLALESSKHRRYATIDLSEASDRVAFWLVQSMFNEDEPAWHAIAACRSARAQLPETSGLTMPLELKKFASMGSALCFPVEAMVFYAICLCGVIESKEGLLYGLSTKDIQKYAGEVFVYGDDIIVPASAVQTVRHWLEAFGLKVNESKTFARGNFRESCGMDAYDGHDVTPCYLRRMPPSSWHDANEIVSYVSFANQLYKKGLWQTAAYVRREVEDLTGPLPFRS